MADGIENNIAGKIVVITGASSGLGAETARHLAKAGAKLVLGARRLDRLEAMAAEIGEENCAARATDVRYHSQVKALVDLAVQLHGRVDVVINNAGVGGGTGLSKLDIAQWDNMVDVNIKGVLHGIAAALPHMQKQQSGHIINIASVAGHMVSARLAVYAATKHAVRALSEGLRQDVKPYNIRTTIISPGYIATEILDHVSADMAEEVEKVRKFALPASSFARAVMFAISQPEEVDVNEIIFRPTAQPL